MFKIVLIKKVLAMFALATMAFVTMPSNEADARRGGGGGGGFRAGGGGGGAFRGGGGFRGPAFRGGGSAFRGPRVVVRPIYGYRRPIRRHYAGPVFIAGGGCAWLRQRAVVSGSPYWWRRYNACRLGY